MTNTPDFTPLDDRAHDKDLDRLRDSAAHVIDVVRRAVRAELAAGAHPIDAMANGTTMLELWETGMTLAVNPSPTAYTRMVEAELTRAYELVGAERLWKWLREPSDALDGETPLRALVDHRVRAVHRLINAIPKPPAPDSEAGAGRNE